MAEKRQFRFKIDAYTRETMPMKRLAEYLSGIAAVLGDDAHVHLVGIDEGSTVPIIQVDPEAEPKITERVHRAKNREGSADSHRAVDAINALLKKDNASAELVGPADNKILYFPGARDNAELEWPSINQPTTLYGVPVWVGGLTPLSRVTLQDGTDEHVCLTDRETAAEIGHHLYKGMLRVSGDGRWRKLPGGPWNLERYTISNFEVIKESTFDDVVQELRLVNAEWKEHADPLAELAAIRYGKGGRSNGGI
jgi:hypothetical protein